MPDRLGSPALRRWTEAAIGLFLLIRLVVLSSDALRSRDSGFPGEGEYFSGRPHFFDPHVVLMRVTSAIVVALTLYLALQIRGHAGHVIVAMVAVAAVGYAVASFFGPTRWTPSVNGPYVDQIGDAAGYARLLTAEILLDALLVTAVVRLERGRRRALAMTGP
jgi:hypothetical protein